jgi:alkanesulfonate monooxygenase SsuD/methylene tetrahydromethanopterin reductase-like flavin-dependent oxidoreductase (luciferase family)
MRFGIFYEHQLPRPWAPDDERRLLTDALEQVELADRLGFDYLWEVEHHLQKWKFPPTRAARFRWNESPRPRRRGLVMSISEHLELPENGGVMSRQSR